MDIKCVVCSCSSQVLIKLCKRYINNAPPGYSDKDLTQNQIQRDEKDIQSVSDPFLTAFTNSSKFDLISVSNGLLATEEVKNDLLNALQKGAEAMNSFIEDRVKDDFHTEFFQLIKNRIKKAINTSVKDKAMPIKSYSKIFGQVAFLM